MKTFNKLLQRQINKHFGAPENIPEALRPFLEVINETYLHQEKDRKMLERSIELSSGEMKDLNSELRKETEEIKISEHRFRKLIEYSSDAIAIIGADGKPLYTSPSVKTILGYTGQEVMQMDIFTLTHPDDIPPLIKVMEQVLESPGIPVKGHTGQMLHKNGIWRWIESIATNLLHDPAVNGIVYNFWDITERKLAEERMLHATRLYSFISQINQTILRADNEQSLFKEACKIAMEFGKFKVAWIGEIDDEQKKVNLIEQYGLPPENASLFSDISYGEDSVTEYVLQTGNYYVCNNVEKDFKFKLNNWKSLASALGFRSCMVLPLKRAGKIIGIFNLYAAETDYFDIEEITLLYDAADDISFALDVFENKKLHLHAENKLKHRELRLRQAQEIAHLGSWDLDFSTGLATWTDEHCRIFGVPLEDNIHSYESWLSFVHPDDLEYVLKASKEGEASAKSFSFYHRIIRNDGAVRHIYSQNHFEYNNEGIPVSFYGASHDVTEIKEAEEQLLNANRLYAFTSQINQTIVHVTDKQALFDKACRIAVTAGNFELACVDKIDGENKKLNLVAHGNVPDGDLKLFSVVEYAENVAILNILHNDTFYVINDYSKEPEQTFWKDYAFSRDFQSAIILPIKKSGKIKYLFSLFSKKANIFDEKEIALLQEATGDISFALDVFEKEKQRKLLEDKISHNEQRLKQAQEFAHFGSWELDFSTGVATWSEEACRIYGLAAEDNIQSYAAWVSFIHPDDLDYVMKATREAQTTLSRSSFYHRIVRKDGAVRHIYSQSEYDLKNGAPVGMHGVAHDVTDIKIAEQNLLQSQANLRMIVDLIPQAICARNYDGEYVFVNKSYADLYGLTPKELITKTIQDTIPEKNESTYFINQDREVIDTRQTKIIPELIFTDHKGQTRVFHTVKVPYTVAGKTENAVLGVSTDITDQKITEVERNKMIADIVQRNKNLEQFSYIVSHNLRAPVANIIGISYLMQNSNYNKDEEKTLMHGLATSVTKLDTVIKDLNDILQVKQQVSEKKELVSFTGLVNDIELSIRHMMDEQNVSIVHDFSAVDQMFTVKSYLYSIFYNLINNSIKYRRPGIPPVIEITSKTNGQAIELIFKDNGLGIDLEKNKAYIFGLYKRFHFEAEGKGMGLFMVKTQVETLGGKIFLESEVNKGSVFTIIFENVNY